MSLPSLTNIASAAFDKAVAEEAKTEETKTEPKLTEEKTEDTKNPEVSEKEENTDDKEEPTTVDKEEDADEKTKDKFEEGTSSLDPAIDQDDFEEEPETGDELPEPQQYVYDRLPTITVRGKDGEEGEVKEFKVKIPEELPENFIYASHRDQAIFNARFAQQDRAAADLFKDYQSQEQRVKVAEFERQEALDIRSDMEELQKDGVLPKFKYASTDKRFNDDPAVKEVQKVLEYYTRKNGEFARAGKAYRIPFSVAAQNYYVINPKPKADEKIDPVKTKGDADRKEVAKKTAPTRGSDANTKFRPRPARSMEEILARHARDFD